VVRIPERFKVGIELVDPLGADDAEAIDAFQRANFPPDGRQVDAASRTWLFRQNPHAGPEGPAFWVCRRDGAIVGQQTEMPVDLKIGADRRRGSWAIDLVVEGKWRLRGVGPALIATMLEHRTIVGVLYASRDGYPAFLNSGCIDLGPMHRYRRPLDPATALQHPRVPARLRKLAPVIGPALRVVDGGAAAATRLAGARLVPTDAFDERSDEVWAAVADSYPVLALRDREALAWKIDQRPDQHLLRRFYLVRGRKALGYVVLRPTASSVAERTAVVVDYLAPPRWVAPLLLAAGREARKDGAVALSCRTRNPQADRALRAAGFLRTPQADEWPIHHLVHCTDEAGICALVHDSDCWFLTAADGDLESALPPAHDDTNGAL
jgi:GNAT superfamily N-acetyltransferase